MGTSMRMDVLQPFRVRLVRSVALLAVAGLAAGCSADVARFDDGFYTGAVPRQPVPQSGIAQAYPGDVDQVNTGSVRQGMPMSAVGSNPGAGVAAQGLSGADASYGRNTGYSQAPVTRTASIERNMLPPPPVAQPAITMRTPAAPAVMPAPVEEPMARELPRAAAAPMASGKPTKAGWSDTGNRVALRGGESIETLADRYGVPAKAILAVNGMKSSADAQAGQSIVIPTYSYGASPGKAHVDVASGQTLGTPPGPLRVPDPSAVPAAPLPAPVHAASAAKGHTVVVESGDSVNGIARRNGVSAAALREANGISDDNIRIGQKLVLPAGATPAKRVASTEPKPAEKAPTEKAPAHVAAPVVAAVEPAQKQPKAYEPPRAEAVKEQPKPAVVAEAPAAPSTTVAQEAEAQVETAAPSSTGIDQFRWPVQGRVVKRFGEKSGSRRSDGLDISVPRGTPIKAAENGVVIYAGDGLKEFGNTVLVKHDNGLVTVYGHADDLKVKRGATVKRGEEIATAGMTGDTDTPQVHFEVRKDSAPVDPMKFLR